MDFHTARTLFSVGISEGHRVSNMELSSEPPLPHLENNTPTNPHHLAARVAPAGINGIIM